jgi:hypothetical protein
LINHRSSYNVAKELKIAPSKPDLALDTLVDNAIPFWTFVRF